MDCVLKKVSQGRFELFPIRWVRSYFYRSLLFSLFFFSANFVRADWSAEEVLQDVEDFSVLADSSWMQLQEKVLKSLQGTWCSSEKACLLMELTVLTRPQTCVEVGVFSGATVLPVAASLQYLGSGKIFAIDAWSNSQAIEYLEVGDPNRQWWSAVNMSQVYRQFSSLLSSWGFQNCQTIRAASAAAAISVETIDFLHLDGGFSEEISLQDAKLYVPKVKEGGYILLSNALLSANGRQPKMKSILYLFEECLFVCEADYGNALLFRKISQEKRS